MTPFRGGSLSGRFKSLFARLGNVPVRLLEKQRLAGAVSPRIECAIAFYAVYSRAAGKAGTCIIGNMLLGLTIRDVVLIDRLSLAFRPGLCVLTGETGAGKSILLDALGLALGRRAEAGLVRTGAKEAAVSAEFAVGRNHPAHAILREAGLDGDLSG